MGAGSNHNATRRRRFDPAILPVVPDGAIVWKSRDAFAVATPTAAMIGFVTAALREEMLEPAGEVLLVRHQPGDRGVPDCSGSGEYRFALDLTGARSSVLGGALLFLDDTGRGSGWRAEAGALTIWRGPDPELTELVPGVGPRLTLMGAAKAASAEP